MNERFRLYIKANCGKGNICTSKYKDKNGDERICFAGYKFMHWISTKWGEFYEENGIKKDVRGYYPGANEKMQREFNLWLEKNVINAMKKTLPK